MEDRKNGCSLVLLLSFVFGVLLGICVSPDSGSNNRSKLKYRMGNLVDNFKASVDKFLNYIKSLNLDASQDKEGERIVKETMDKADQIMSEI
ncbi:MAG: hypothetical protein LBD32_00785 [Cytophagales bacterium]|jgi:hypothetical protein|nr:hypothetical protein [Cytophagales bacterium]